MKKKEINRCFKCNLPLFGNAKVGDICPSCKERAEADEITNLELYDEEANGFKKEE